MLTENCGAFQKKKEEVLCPRIFFTESKRNWLLLFKIFWLEILRSIEKLSEKKGQRASGIHAQR